MMKKKQKKTFITFNENYDDIKIISCLRILYNFFGRPDSVDYLTNYNNT